jgi:nucleoside-diphosphate-sugar epimerase
MNNTLHVVVGGTGAIGTAVIEELKRLKLNSRVVSQKGIFQGVELVRADVLNYSEISVALTGATHVYLCVSLPFKTKLWEEQWPIVIQNIISFCEASKAKLIFIDNMYMYGPRPFQLPIEETHTQMPVHRLGEIRKSLASNILNAHKEGRIKAVIGRSTDFYGATPNSMLYILFLENMLKGNAPQTFGDLTVKHSYAFVKDNGRALVQLALDDGAYGEVWHLPTSSAITLTEVNQIFNRLMSTNYKLTRIPDFVQKIMSMLMPSFREMRKVVVVFNENYVVSSEKFLKRYPEFQVTPIEEGLSHMVDYYKAIRMANSKKL